MRKNIMLTLLFLCAILIFVDCKNGYETIKETNGDEDADNSLKVENSLVVETSSRRK